MSHDDGSSAFDAAWWEQHYQAAQSGRSLEAPSPYVTDEIASLRPGSVLDAGCGTGAAAVWLARRGWDVTAVDIAPTAVERARVVTMSTAPEIASRITWLATDLMTWEPPRRFDVVLSQYVHPDAPFGQFVARLARATAAGGTLIVVGHEHSDAHSTAHAPYDASVSSTAIADALDPNEWAIEVAETRERRVVRGENEMALTDVVVRAHRRP